MFSAYDVKPGEASSSSNHDGRPRKRKLPPSTDVRVSQLSQPYDDFYSSTTSKSSTLTVTAPSHPYMEINETPSYHQQPLEMDAPFQDDRRRKAKMTGSQYSTYNMRRYSLQTPCSLVTQSPSYDTHSSTVAVRTTELFSMTSPHHLSPYPQHVHDTQPVKSRHSSFQPISVDVSQSTAAPSLESPLPISPLQATNRHRQAALHIHQPRPSRRIPIISLSQLASACEDSDTASQQRSPQESLSNPPGISDYGRRQPLEKLGPDKRVHPTATAVWEGNRFGRVLQCSCGCMESFTVG